MITFWIMIVGMLCLFIVITIAIQWRNGKEVSDSLLPLGLLFTVLAILCFVNLTRNEKVEVTKTEIYSLGMNKSFFLGTDGTEYLYYTGDSISGFKIESVPAMKTTIKYTDENPFVIINKVTISEGFSSFTKIEDVELFIPHGSIVKNYKIDL